MQRISLITCHLVDTMPQCITISINIRAQAWMCSAVYASPTYSIRSQCWSYLEGGTLMKSCLPWNSGVASSRDPKPKDLQQLWIIATWWIWIFLAESLLGRKGVGVVLSYRQDWIVGWGYFPWRMQFPEATVEHLIKRHSIHHPLLLRCSSDASSRDNRPFRFQAAWCPWTGWLPTYLL